MFSNNLSPFLKYPQNIGWHLQMSTPVLHSVLHVPITGVIYTKRTSWAIWYRRTSWLASPWAQRFSPVVSREPLQGSRDPQSHCLTTCKQAPSNAEPWASEVSVVLFIMGHLPEGSKWTWAQAKLRSLFFIVCSTTCRSSHAMGTHGSF